MTRPRLGDAAWTRTLSQQTAAVFNANYAANGDRLLDLDKPWTVLTPYDFRAFTTHAEAISWAMQEYGPSATQRRLDQAQREWRARV